MEKEHLSKDKPLLSICIPTYNRCEYLKETLENITSDPDFNDKVEIVISDNASTDNTKEIAELYCNKFENVRYFRNNENVRDANFNLCLTRATGEYRKLNNDTCRIKEGKLKIILEALKDNEKKIPIFFCPASPFLKKGVYTCSGVIDIINKVGFYLGWILMFGAYQEDLKCMDVDKKYVQLQFAQVAWTLEIVKKHSAAIVVVDDFYKIFDPPKKGGYNFFKVQITNLFSIFSEYGLKGLDYERQKYRLFKYHIKNRIKEYLILKEETGFDLSDSWKTLFKEYGLRPYFLSKLISYYIRNSLHLLKSKKDER
ncbi:MAG: glycosyltransferase family 2 protein [Muribaculaceae bacterium]|nr:glycosyltransferase family 2 protein [Muribaculaceae bacterium]